MNVLVNVENRSPQEQRAYYNKLFSMYETLKAPLLELEELSNKCKCEEQYIEKLKKEGTINKVGILFIISFMTSIIYVCMSGLCQLFIDSPNEGIVGVISFILCVIVFIIAYKHYIDQRVEEIQEKIESYNQLIKENYSSNIEKYQFIPNGYFSYDAIKYFTQCYSVGKASDLKEAMQLYDLYLHQQRMELGQQQILNQQQQIAKNQNSIRKEMAFDTAILFLSRF